MAVRSGNEAEVESTVPKPCTTRRVTALGERRGNSKYREERCNTDSRDRTREYDVEGGLLGKMAPPAVAVEPVRARTKWCLSLVLVKVTDNKRGRTVLPVHVQTKT